MAAALGAHLGRAGILGRNNFLLSSIKKPLIVSLCCTFASLFGMKETAEFRKEGWLFYARHLGQSEYHKLEESGVKLPNYTSTSDFTIRHLDSGIEFGFNSYDALRKWKMEKETGRTCPSDLPSYRSPLRPVFDQQYDSAYLGSVSLVHPLFSRKKNPIWEYIDWETLDKHTVWSVENEKVVGAPPLKIYGGSECFLNKEAKEFKGKTFKGKGLLDPLVHFWAPLYCNASSPDEGGYSFAFVSMVVVDSGWFFFLGQQFYNNHGDKRIREMTLRCNFTHYVLLREIIEMQSKDFGTRHRKIYKTEDHGDGEMCVRFHKAQQMDLKVAYTGKPSLPMIAGAKRYKPFTVADWRTASLEALDISGTEMESLFFKYGEEIKLLEARLGTRIQIAPLFHHPYNPTLCASAIFKPIPRKAYVHVTEDNVDTVKSWKALLNSSNLC